MWWEFTGVCVVCVREMEIDREILCMCLRVCLCVCVSMCVRVYTLSSPLGCSGNTYVCVSVWVGSKGADDCSCVCDEVDLATSSIYRDLP